MHLPIRLLPIPAPKEPLFLCANAHKLPSILAFTLSHAASSCMPCRGAQDNPVRQRLPLHVQIWHADQQNVSQAYSGNLISVEMCLFRHHAAAPVQARAYQLS